MSTQAASTSTPAAAPSPQEITRKLSVYSKPPKTRPNNLPQTTISGTESDSDSVISPELSPLALHSLSHQHGVAHTAQIHGSLTGAVKPLGSIKEHSRDIEEGDQEDDSDEEEDEEDGDGGLGLTQQEEALWKSQAARGETAIKSGYLLKKGERRKTWKKRWLVLRPAHLAFYKNNHEYKLLRLVDLSEIHSCTTVDLKRHKHSFGMVLPSRTYYLQADSDKEAQAWVRELNQARELLFGTSTQNSFTTSTMPIPIPSTPGGRQGHDHSVPVTPSPPSHQGGNYGLTSESDSEDATTIYSSPPPIINPVPLTKASQMPKDPAKPVLSGYLMKTRSKRKTWRKRYFTLTGEKLVYSPSHMDTKHQRTIELSQVLDAFEYEVPNRHHYGIQSPVSPSTHLSTSVPKSYHSSTGGHATSVTSAGTDDPESSANIQNTFKIVTTKRALLLCAPSEEEEIKWLSAIRALIARRSGGAGPGSIQGSKGSSGQAATGSSSAGAGTSVSGTGSVVVGGGAAASVSTRGNGTGNEQQTTTTSGHGRRTSVSEKNRRTRSTSTTSGSGIPVVTSET